MVFRRDRSIPLAQADRSAFETGLTLTASSETGLPETGVIQDRSVQFQTDQRTPKENDS